LEKCICDPFVAYSVRLCWFSKYILVHVGESSFPVKMTSRRWRGLASGSTAGRSARDAMRSIVPIENKPTLDGPYSFNSGPSAMHANPIFGQIHNISNDLFLLQIDFGFG
jgi:hypothetical protein